MGSARAEMTERMQEYLVTQSDARPTGDAGQDENNSDILRWLPRQQVLQRGEEPEQDQVLAVLQLPDDRLEAVGAGPRVPGCAGADRGRGQKHHQPENRWLPGGLHFCSQSGLFASPVRSAWLDIPSLVRRPNRPPSPAPRVLLRGRGAPDPTKRLMAQVAAGIERFAKSRCFIACSLGMLTASKWTNWRRGCIATTTTSKRRVLRQRRHHHTWKSAGRRYRWCVTRA